jgi:hypothetical protein
LTAAAFHDWCVFCGAAKTVMTQILYKVPQPGKGQKSQAAFSYITAAELDAQHMTK